MGPLNLSRTWNRVQVQQPQARSASPEPRPGALSRATVRLRLPLCDGSRRVTVRRETS